MDSITTRGKQLNKGGIDKIMIGESCRQSESCRRLDKEQSEGKQRYLSSDWMFDPIDYEGSSGER